MPSGRIGSGTKLGNKCIDCSEILSTFNASFNGYNLRSRCKPCWNIHSNKNPSRANGARKAQYVQWKYGISIGEYKKKLEIQLNGCAICKQPCNTGRQLAIDHDHKTGVIRDLLCQRCNAVLGLINEDENLLIEIIEYIKRHLNQEIAS